jgi:hypothetical protein
VDEAKRDVQDCVKVVEGKWSNSECDKAGKEIYYACEKPLV